MISSLQNIYDATRKWTRTNTTTLPNAELLTETNQTYLEIQRKLAANAIEVFGMISHTDLIANQDSYVIPDDALEVVRIEVNWDDPTDDKLWVKASFTDLANLPWEMKNALKNAPACSPLIDQFGSQFFVMPKAINTEINGLRLWWIKKQSDFAGTSPSTEKIPWPINLRYEAVSHGNAYRYWLPKNDTEAAKYKGLYDAGVQEIIDDLKNETIEPIKTQSVDFTSNGWM